MRARDLRKWTVAATLGAMALMGGTVAASDYPPGDESVTTVPQGGDTTPSRPEGELPATGSDSNSTLKVAGGAVVAGAGLLVAARMRRRPSSG
jgi:LPXTG-motif cell wall-anchored protein